MPPFDDDGNEEEEGSSESGLLWGAVVVVVVSSSSSIVNRKVAVSPVVPVTTSRNPIDNEIMRMQSRKNILDRAVALAFVVVFVFVAADDAAFWWWELRLRLFVGDALESGDSDEDRPLHGDNDDDDLEDEYKDLRLDKEALDGDSWLVLLVLLMMIRGGEEQ